MYHINTFESTCSLQVIHSNCSCTTYVQFLDKRFPITNIMFTCTLTSEFRSKSSKIDFYQVPVTITCVMSANNYHRTVTHPTNAFSYENQIWWTILFEVIQLQGTRSQHIFAHDTTAQLSWHVQNFVVITLLESKKIRIDGWMISENVSMSLPWLSPRADL